LPTIRNGGYGCDHCGFPFLGSFIFCADDRLSTAANTSVINIILLLIMGELFVTEMFSQDNYINKIESKNYLRSGHFSDGRFA
jgi:hypothetical protein